MAEQAVRLELDKKSLAYLAKLEAIKGKEELYKLLDPFFARQALIAAGHITKTQLSGQRIKRRTGSLARSMVGIGLRQSGVPALKVGVLRGPALKYAGLLQEGTVGKGGTLPTIVPKKAKALAIPVGDTLTPAGVDRFGGPRKYPGALKFVPFRKSGVAVGALYDADRLRAAQKAASRAGQPVDLQDVGAVYLLLRKVDVTPYRYLTIGFDEYLPRLTAALAKELVRLMRADVT